jgi:mono/diheme cytochrome c family protein/uncharacterized membrane protein
MDTLQKQQRKLSEETSTVAPSRPSQPPQPEDSRPATPTAAGGSAVRELFRQRCVKCHGADGTGRPARGRLPEIPNFTDASWQTGRSDAQLLASILDGKDEMPGWRGKISEQQVRGLVAHVRAFAPAREATKGAPHRPPGQGGAGRGSSPAPATPKAASPTSPDELVRHLEELVHQLQLQIGRLDDQVRELQAQNRKPSGDSRAVAPSQTSRSSRHETSRPSPPTADRSRNIRELFHKHCEKCHGADGRGEEARDRLPEIPDFTDASWQARRADAKLLASILDGKGSEMPPHRGKIDEAQARGLVAYVRTFARTTGKSGQADQEGPARDEQAEDVPTGRFFEKLIRWLGRFHPAAVHFPIALLTAAAVAELLRMATGKPAFDAIARYCVWFGVLTALVAGTLGWFMGRFRLTDASWVMMTHRWLGTSTVVCAGLALVLSELSRRPDRRRTRMVFRIAVLALAVLVSVTGFFGGAVAYGLDHYAWPR